MPELFSLTETDCDLIRQRLWYADLRDGWVCVNGFGHERFLVLFTSQAGAREYFGLVDSPDGELPITLVFSEDEGEFRRLAQDAWREGLNGALILPDGDETAQSVVRFAVAEEG